MLILQYGEANKSMFTILYGSPSVKIMNSPSDITQNEQRQG